MQPTAIPRRLGVHGREGGGERGDGGRAGRSTSRSSWRWRPRQMSARGTTSSSASAMVVVNGPIRHEIGMNCGIGAMGPYNHANATIGRAYGLLSQNLQGGSEPGETFMGSQGNSYTYNNVTFAENEERSPWEPLHVQKGFKPEDSTVSIFYGCRSTTFCLGLREKYWREHVRDMLAGIDAHHGAVPAARPDHGAAVHRPRRLRHQGEADPTGSTRPREMPAGRYWDLQLVQNYVYPRATFGEEPMATWLKASAGRADPHLPRSRTSTWSWSAARPTATGGSWARSTARR